MHETQYIFFSCIFYTKCTYVCEPSLKESRYVLGWIGWWCIVQFRQKKTAEHLCSDVLCFYNLHHSSTHSCAAWSWGEHQLKTASLITVWIVSSLLKIDLYLDTLDQLGVLCFLDGLCLCFLMVYYNTFLSSVFFKKEIILHWHSDLALTALWHLCTSAVDRCKPFGCF